MRKYKFPRRDGIDNKYLTELEALLNSQKNIDSGTLFPDQIKAFQCGQILLKHINKNNLQGGFCLLQIMNLNRSYIYGGADKNQNVWKQIMEIIASCLPAQSYISRVSLGVAIHYWGQDIENNFKATLEKIKNKLLIDNASFVNETAIHMPIITRIGYLIYPDDCGYKDSFKPITCYAAMTSSDIEPVNKSSYFRRFDHDFLNKVNQRFESEKKLIDAILNGGFELFYQPVIDLVNHKIISAESLLRWKSPGLSQNRNDEYIPIIENSKYITSFTEYTFEALTDFIERNYHLLPIDFRISFNLSQSVFKWENFQLVEMIENAINTFPYLPNVLIIEITESAYFSKSISDEVLSSLMQIKELGIQIAIDDFGSGYGALKLISSNIPDIIKLDKEVTKEICNTQEDSTFLKSLIYAASLSKFKIIAEGIETNQQQTLMLYYGIRFAQGYNFSKALNEKDFLQFLNDYHL